MTIRTPLTTALGTQAPIIAAPLGRGSSPQFVAAVADAGAFGFVGLMHVPETQVAQQLETYNRTVGAGRFGVNLTLIRDQHRRLDAALEAGVRVVSLWYGDPTSYVAAAKAANATVFWTVGTAEDAARATDLGVDFVVCQGREAGGHLVGAAGQMSLLPNVVDAAERVPVVAAGGIADGRGLAAALSLGAVGVWMGTRFVASNESASHTGYKGRLVHAEPSDLVETRLFDGGWPDSPHRVIRNSTVTEWEDAGRPLPGSRPHEGEPIGRYPDGRPFLRYTDASPWDSFDGDWEAGPHYAGESVQLVRDIDSVRNIVDDAVRDAEQALRRAISMSDPEQVG
ncbi:NAD(P)H-dependent flavin oxidoreductase [Streptosporangium sp. CA-115845]|uniref:NAD(P)H-dependent flavin oxidoreductase n=1 Tax=Streptosporangium sp. CA-115845 TaxID=3240071 RepID=UPI003D920711